MTDNNFSNGNKKPMVELRSEQPEEFGNNSGESKKGKYIGIGVVVVVVLAVIGLGLFAAINKSGNEKNDLSMANRLLPKSDDRVVEEPNVPTGVSGLSGMTCANSNRRAIAVMLASDPINRPVLGFSTADMVWEVPVLVSNVTRLMAVYQCNAPTDIGSVRSARHDYLFLAEGLDAIVAHWGGSYHALNRIAAGEFDTINALSNPFNAYYRKDNLPAPYNGFTSYDRLWNALVRLGYRTTTEFKGYQFKDDIDVVQRPAGGTLTVMWPGQFKVAFEYDPKTNRYVRFWGGVKDKDAENGELITPSAVVVMRATNDYADGPGGYNDVGIEGAGEMEVYQDGTVIKGTWRKDELYKTDPVHFLDEQGNPIVFTRGQLWVVTPSAEIPVTWEVTAADSTISNN